MEGQMKPQAVSGPAADARIRIAMQLGAAMHEAQTALTRPDAGMEAAAMCGRAARIAVLAFVDMSHPETPGFPFALVNSIAQQAYGAEWQRLMCTSRAQWHA